MKVAVYDPHPRICGVTIWGEHLRDGFRRLGHECDFVTVTKSGKPSVCYKPDYLENQRGKAYADKGILWYWKEPDRIGKLNDVSQFFNAYDLIVLVEPTCPPQDKQAKANLDIATYHWALKQTLTPWVTHVHGPYYTGFTDEIYDNFALPNFRGFGYFKDWDVSHKPFVDLKEKYPHVSVPVIPYTAKRKVDDPICYKKSLSYTGRIEIVKGLNYLMFAADHLPADWRLDMWGAATVSRSPSVAHRLAEGLQAMGFEVKFVYDEGALAAIERGKVPVLKAFPWSATKEEHVVEYHGAYQMHDLHRIDYHSPEPKPFCEMLHTGVTSPTFNQGILETTSLEAIDAGSYGIYSDCQLSKETADFDCVWLENHRPLPGNLDQLPKMVKEDDTWAEQVRDFLDCVDEALTVAGDKRAFEKAVRHNRRVLQHRNDPANCAKIFLKLAFE